MKINFFIALMMLFFICVINSSYANTASLSEPKNKASDIVSLNFQDIKVRAVLQLLAEFSGLNIVATDSVNGSVTLHLENIPWQQALDILLQSQNLGKRQIGNAILIAPLSEIANHEREALEAEQEVEDFVPLQSALIEVNYGKAADIASLLKGQGSSLLSARGSVSVDARTNTLWIEDIPQKLGEIRQLIHQLDVPVKQVLIEARIVNIDCSFEEELGVHFKVTQAAEGTDALPKTSGPLFNMDLAAAPLGGTDPASMGLALAHLGAGTLLDLELSALESEGGGKVISSPRLITADQQTAKIQSGEEIPYQQSSSSGATNIAFKDAVLSLHVTPQITPDGKVMLTLKLNQDTVGSRMVHGVPSINTREIESQTLVENNETVVLGGIYETDNSNRVKRVPMLASLPFIGNLFKHTSNDRGHRELLIFVTPHILQPDLASRAH